MSFARVYSGQVNDLRVHTVSVEVDLSRGLYNFSIVGLPDKAVEEARDRFSAAIKHSQFKSPKEKNQRVVISLAPADIKKEGPAFDLPIAIAYLSAAGDIPTPHETVFFVGELSLDGTLRPIRGILALVRHAQESGFTQIIVPKDNAREAALIKDIAVYPAETIRDVTAHVAGTKPLAAQPPTDIVYEQPKYVLDLSDVRGQESAKRGLEIAAAGRHNVALFGPPGTGKTLLARAFTGILPPLSHPEVLEVTSIHSIAGTLDGALITHPPLRTPHHTASYVSLVGGGAIPKPGEVTLAHRGVLFLDEFPEFDRRVIEALRQPLEDKVVSVTRARGSAQFPANFILLAALNPCPCGYFGTNISTGPTAGKSCTCTPSRLEQYRKKLSGPIIDRIDLWLSVESVPHEQLSQKAPRGESSKEVAKRVVRARKLQEERFGNPVHTNADMQVRDVDTIVTLDDATEMLLKESAKHLELSARAYHKVIKLARTIADLDGARTLSDKHILEALSYRPKTLSPF